MLSRNKNLIKIILQQFTCCCIKRINIGLATSTLMEIDRYVLKELHVCDACICCVYRIAFTLKNGGHKTIKFTDGRGNIMQIRSTPGGLSVSVGPGLPKDTRRTSNLYLLRLIVHFVNCQYFKMQIIRLSVL